MDVAAKELGAFERQANTAELKPRARLGEQGTSAGINTEAGSNDDGWEIPSPVMLEDGTRVQLYKDGRRCTRGLMRSRRRKSASAWKFIFFTAMTRGGHLPICFRPGPKRACRFIVIYDSLGCIDSDPKMFEQMRAAGVRLAEFPSDQAVGMQIQLAAVQSGSSQAAFTG